MTKSTTTVNDILLIYMEDAPLAFARVEDIQPDIKPGWFRIKLLVLQIPPAIVTWILRDAYIDGDEYTMGGKRMRLEKVTIPEDPEAASKGPSTTPAEKTERKKEASSEKNKVISLADMKKRRPGE
jgi:hypothetical protein